jgi:hypothetical protein
MSLFWQLSREKSLIAKRCEMKGNSGHTSKANFGSDICEIAVDTVITVNQHFE